MAVREEVHVDEHLHNARLGHEHRADAADSSEFARDRPDVGQVSVGSLVPEDVRAISNKARSFAVGVCLGPSVTAKWAKAAAATPSLDGVRSVLKQSSALALTATATRSPSSHSSTNQLQQGNEGVRGGQASAVMSRMPISSCELHQRVRPHQILRSG